MLQQPISTSFDIGGDRLVTIGTGKLARQADGAVTVTQGKCTILATVVANKEPKEGQEFFPLVVDYMEKFASAGRIPGSFFKREGKLSDYEVLISRLIDRALRPLFPEDYFCDVQVLVTLISSDPEVMPDSLACLAASAANLLLYWRFSLHFTALQGLYAATGALATGPNGPACDALKPTRFAILSYDYGSVRKPVFFYWLFSVLLFGLSLLGLHWWEQDERARKRATLAPVPAPSE